MNTSPATAASGTEPQQGRFPNARPALSGPVLWTLGASLSEVTDAGGLPQRIHDELTRMLDSW